MGYAPEEIPGGVLFADFLSEKDMFDPLTKREIRACLNGLFFSNPGIDNNFAICSALITGGLLGYPALEAAYSVFAFNSSYVPDVIDAKHEYENLDKNLGLMPVQQEKILTVLGEISSAKQLAPLNQEEITEILSKIQEHHGLAYHWTANIDPKQLLAITDQYSYLLRTRIRAAIEILDQLFQYGEFEDLHLHELGQISFEEEEEESPEEFL